MKQQDPGLQPERTRLAWSRTTIALLINALLLLRIAIVTNRLHHWVTALLLSILLLTIFVFVYCRNVQLTRSASLPYVNRWMVTGTSAASALAALCGFLLMQRTGAVG
jgi:uncharacterized membrane protein YidH (DUF202 family)